MARLQLSKNWSNHPVEDICLKAYLPALFPCEGRRPVVFRLVEPMTRTVVSDITAEPGDFFCSFFHSIANNHGLHNVTDGVAE